MTVADCVRGVQVGNRYGERVVIGSPFVTGRFGKSKTKRLWSVVVQCDCGRVNVVQLGNLKGGGSAKCKQCHARQTNTKHGGAPATRARESLHNIWCSMRQRCNDAGCKAYRRYGGRGIKVCKEWDSYPAFRSWANAAGYVPGLTIDRIDNDKGYSPDNCQWLTLSDNSKKQHTDRRKREAMNV